MPIIIKLKMLTQDKYIFVNASKVQCFYQNKGDNDKPYTVIEFRDGDTTSVKETPAEIVKLIKEAESDRIKQKMDIVDEVVEHRKEKGLPPPMALPLPILVSL